MTIYYVDPVAGSNSNSGTSWGSAWKWLPGNGTSIVAGDEVRFAKSPTQDTASLLLRGSTEVEQTGYTSWNIPTAWELGSGGGYVEDYLRWRAAPGTSVPANTKLMYVEFSGSITFGNGIAIVLRMRGIPTGDVGQYLQISLCSDTAGNTPVVNLTGRTLTSTSSPEGTVSVVSFNYNSASTLSLSVGSIAVRSVGAFTVESVTDGALIETGPTRIHITPNQTGTAYLPQGSAYEVLSPRPPSNALTAYGYTRRDIYHHDGDWPPFGSTSLALLPKPRLSNFPNTSASTSHVLRVYAPLPIAIYALHTTNLSYNGTAGSRIKMTGGWDTASGLRDGMTNTAIAGMAFGPRRAAFNYSSGNGQYIEYEGFISMQGPLVGFDYAVSTIPLLKFTECVLGCGGAPDPLYYGAGVIGAAHVAVGASSSSVTVTTYEVTRCTLENFLTVSRGFTGDKGAFMGTTGYPLTVSNATFTDCFVWSPGAYSNRVTFNNTTFASTTAGQIGSYIGGYSTTLTLGPSSSVIKIKDTGLVGNFVIQGPPGEVSSTCGVWLEDVAILGFDSPSPVGGGTALAPEIGYLKTAIVDGVVFNNPGLANKGQTQLQIRYTPAWRALNGSPDVRIGGPCYTAASTMAYSSTDYIYLVGNGVDQVNATPAPRLMSLATYLGNPLAAFGLRYEPLLTGPSQVRDFHGAFLEVDFPSVPGSFWPNHPEVEFFNCHGKPYVQGGPVGSVRMYGGTALSVYPYELTVNGASPISEAVALYGTQVDTLIDDRRSIYGDNTTNVGWTRRMLAVDLKGSSLKLEDGVQRNSRQSHIPVQIQLDESASIDRLLSFTWTTDHHYAHQRGIHARKRSGDFDAKVGSGYAHGSGSDNAYGKRSIFFRGGMPLATVDVEDGALVSVSLRIAATAMDTDSPTPAFYFRVLIPPTRVHTSGIHEHVWHRQFVSVGADVLLSFSISAQEEGTLPIYIYSSTPAELKDLSVTVT